MINDENRDSPAEFEKNLAEMPDQIFILKLYVIGASTRSSQAVENIRHFCEKYLKGRYELEVIDIHQHPELLQSEEIIASPTLVKKLPLPLRKLIGDMSDQGKIFSGLNIQTREGQKKEESKE